MAALSHIGPYPEISKAYAKLSEILGAQRLWPLAGPMVAVYCDSPATTPADQLRSRAGVVFGPNVALDPPLEVVTLPYGPHAVLRYRGPYSSLSQAYGQLFDHWLPASGRVPAEAAMFEIYLNSPMDTAPEDLLTEICMPLLA